ncbi:MAG TPA: SH3 domain-containing protein [Stellaceae bacterium]|jgi:hypothetical protein|nr:SH3 domain-containing protein [Stellaceae bacterium]
MHKIALATAVVALAAAAVPLTMGRGEAEPLMHFVPPPGAAPPWGTTTTTETKPVPTPAAAPAAQRSGTSVESATTTPNQGTATPIQGNTTPIHTVSLRAGPSGGAPVIGTLHPGEPLRILASAPGGWMQVETSGGSGWAYGSYLAPPSSPHPVP